MRPFYFLAYVSCQLFFRLLLHMSVKGRENIPKTGPFIATSNHIGYFDPVFIGSILKREISYLARAELFDQFFIKNLIKKLNAFPVNRDKLDVASIKTCIFMLKKEKRPLLMFPEGKRIKTGKLGIPRRGIALIAAQTKVPILPIFIQNSNRLVECTLFIKKLNIRIGKVILPKEYELFTSNKSQHSKLATLVMSRIQQLKDQIDI